MDTRDQNSYGTIYEYEIESAIETLSAPQKLAEYQIPYTAFQPSITYNYDLSVLEIIGDYWSTSANHYHLVAFSNFHSFLKISESFYEPDLYSTIVFVEKLGTICVGGYRKDQQVYIVTQSTKWSEIGPEDKYLSEIQGTAYGGVFWLIKKMFFASTPIFHWM